MGNRIPNVLVIAAAVAAACAVSCKSGAAEEAVGFTAEELRLIGDSDSLMRVLSVTDDADEEILRRKSSELESAALLSDDYRILAEKMLATVVAPEHDGVGIAAPQVGISRRMVAVQRFDMEGEPFIVYPNIRIDSLYGERKPGGEGCLSVPGKRGEVLRWSDIIISYTDTGKLRAGDEFGSCTVRDTVSGFTAVIFQHEADHLDGILYTDRAETVTDYRL